MTHGEAGTVNTAWQASWRFCCTAHSSYRIHIHWRSTLDMHLGHAPWTCTLDMQLGTLDATCHTLCHPGACMPHLGPIPWSPTLNPRTPSDPRCLEMPARKGKGAVGWAGLGAGRAPVSRWALSRVQPPRLVGSPGYPLPPPRVVLAPPHRLACSDWQSPCSPATSGRGRAVTRVPCSPSLP